MVVVIDTALPAASTTTKWLVPAGSSVLVVGTEALAAEVEAVGLTTTRSADPAPDALPEERAAQEGETDGSTEILLDGTDLLKLNRHELNERRGDRMAMIFQEPMTSLNPVFTIGDQIVEAYRLHAGGNRTAARQKALDMLAAVQIRDPERVMGAYPHEVSGGMGQRIMIAMMLAPDPEILIADEPTSALDVSVRTEVLNIMDRLVRDRGMGLIFISHDLNLVAQFCDRVLIMYAGRVVEELPARELHSARHPYTRGLLDSLPRLDHPVERLAVLQRQDSWRDAEIATPLPGGL